MHLSGRLAPWILVVSLIAGSVAAGAAYLSNRQANPVVADAGQPDTGPVATGGPVTPDTEDPVPEVEPTAPSGLRTATARPAPTAPPTGPHVTLPILLYHYIRVNPEAQGKPGWDLSVSPVEFERQMAYLRAAGAHTITMTQLMRALSTGAALPPRAVALTFDDGYADFATAAAPIMERYGEVGTDYVVSGFVGRPNYMTADQVLQVAAAGMAIGAHTVHHINLTKAPLAVAAYEIEGSKQDLEGMLQRPVNDFAYPYGGRDPEVEKLVERAGFHDAVTTEPGSTQYLSQRFELRRVRVGAGDGVTVFARKALLPPPAYDVPPPPDTASSPAGPPGGPTPSRSPSPSPWPGPSPSATPQPATPTPRFLF